MRKKIALIIFCSAVLLTGIISAGCIGEESEEFKPDDKIYSDLDFLSGEIQEIFTGLESDMLNASSAVSDESLSNDEVSLELNKILVNYPWLRNILYCTSPDGNAALANPAPDAVIDKNYMTEDMFFGKEAILLPPINSESGGTISGIAVPVYSEDGKYLGAISAWWMSGNFMLCNYDRLSRIGDYHVSFVGESGRISYDSITSVIGEDLKDTKRIIKYTSDNEGTYTHKAGNPVTLASSKISGVWKKIKLLSSEVTVYLGYSEENIPNVLPAKYIDIKPDDAEAAVLDVYSYGRTHSKQQTLRYISSLGNLVGGIFNVYAIDSQGNVLAASGSGKMIVGTNELNFRGACGTRAVREILIRSAQGYGYVEYSHQTSLCVYPKTAISSLAYTMSSNSGDYTICAFIPYCSKIEETHYPQIQKLVSLMNELYSYSVYNGHDALIESINSGYFGEEGIISVINYDGKLLASAQYPEAAGEFVLGVKDSFGSSIIRQAISIARLGGGYAAHSIENNGDRSLYLFEILPIGDYLFLQSAVAVD